MTAKPLLNQAWIDPQALNIIKKLQAKDFTTYLVGGCVRDLLLGLPPKDFDIATSALPDEVNRVIRPSHIIGRRFRLVLVKRFGKQFEISTFRAMTPEDPDDEGPIQDDNTFGSPEEDAKRRDFTINGLFYDPMSGELIDHTNGMDDIHDKVIRMIGEPVKRIQEDPLRMLRALRFAHKANFQMEENLRTAISDLAEQLNLSVLPRKREELLKFMRLKHPTAVLWEAHDLNLLKHLSPTLESILTNEEESEIFESLLLQGIAKITDFNSPHEIFAVLLFSILSAKLKGFREGLRLKDKDKEAYSLLMRNELGMYRVEQDIFFHAINLIHQLHDMKDPKTIRNRYRQHLVKNNSFPVALTLCAAYKLLPDRHVMYWVDEYWRSSE